MLPFVGCAVMTTDFGLIGTTGTLAPGVSLAVRFMTAVPLVGRAAASATAVGPRLPATQPETFPVTGKRGVGAVPPGPAMLKKLVPRGLPVTAMRDTPSLMWVAPVAGLITVKGATAGVRKGPMLRPSALTMPPALPSARAAVKTPGTRPRSWVAG